MVRVLLVDDDTLLCKYMVRRMRRSELDVQSVGGGAAAIDALARSRFEVVVCDLRMPEVDGLEVLSFARKLPDPPPFLMLTAYSSVETAMEAVRLGADDFIQKPADIETLVERINVLANQRRRKTRRAELDWTTVLQGSSPEIARTRRRLDDLARSDAAALIQGETGTGKTTAAEAVWRCSYRSEAPLAVVHCAKPPPEVDEDLFGSSSHPGCIESTTGGVILLEQVEELSLDLQAMLVEILEKRRIRVRQGSRPVWVDVRLLATTAGNLWAAVQRGQFRPELFFRLTGRLVALPPLRRRVADIEALVAHFSRQAAGDTPAPSFAPDAFEALREQPWPGNVRQLADVVTSLVARHPTGPIRADHVRTMLRAGEAAREGDEAGPTGGAVLPEGSSLADAVRGYERGLLERALELSGGNHSEAARLLHISRSTLVDKLKRFGLLR